MTASDCKTSSDQIPVVESEQAIGSYGGKEFEKTEVLRRKQKTRTFELSDHVRND